MPIKVSQDMSSLGTQRFFKSNSAINNSAKPEKNVAKIDRVAGDTVNFKVSKGPRSKNRILSIVAENLNAADSINCGTAKPKEIAVLTKNYILKTSSASMKSQTNS